MPYHDLYGEAYDRGLKGGQAFSHGLLQQQQLAEQIRQHRANELIQSARYMQAARDHAEKVQSGEMLDIQSNRTANEAVPPSAEAVGPNALAANLSRGQYFQAHPMERPDPSLPYMGGHTGLSPYLTANKPPTIGAHTPEAEASQIRVATELAKLHPHNIDRLSPQGQEAENALFDYRQAHGAGGPTATADASAEAVAAKHAPGIPVEKLMGPGVRWSWWDKQTKQPSTFDSTKESLTGNETNTEAQAEVPGYPPVRMSTRGYMEINGAWAKAKARGASRPSPYLPQKSEPGATVRVKQPNGRIGTIPAENLAEALRLGGVQVK